MRRGRGPTKRTSPKTSSREHQHRVEPSDGLCRWFDGDRRKPFRSQGPPIADLKGPRAGPDASVLSAPRGADRADCDSNGIHHKVQWCDRGLYDWLVGVGLTPAKSRTIGPLAVPDNAFADFLRGCIDGDGTVLVYIDSYHATRQPNYVYERLYVLLVSASLRFLDWIRASVSRIVGVFGAIHPSGRRDRPLWTLRYAKAESIRLLRWMYYSPDVPCLGRKRAKASRFLVPLGSASRRSVGRPRVGWLYTDPARDM